MYSTVQKVLLPLATFFPAALILYLLYKVGKRPLLGQQNFNDRMEYLYSFAAAALLGQFLFHALPNATNPSGPEVGAFVRVFVMLGFFIMLCIQKCQRFNHYNPYYTSPENNSVEITSLLDRDSMELVEYYHAQDLESEEVANDRLQLADEAAELSKRRKINVLTLATLVFLSILEGFFLIYREPSWWVWSFFLVDKWLETATIGISMLHALLHCSSETEHRWYLIVSIGWCITCVLSIVPMLVNLNYDAVYQVVNHVATSMFYALAGGVLFWIALYYIWIDRKHVNKKETIVRLIIFGIAAGLSWVSGYFF